MSVIRSSLPSSASVVGKTLPLFRPCLWLQMPQWTQEREQSAVSRGDRKRTKKNAWPVRTDASGARSSQPPSREGW